MNQNANFFENGNDYIPDLMSVDANSDQTGDWVDLSGYDRAYLLLTKAAGVAGDDLAIKLNQASDSSGTGSKDLTFTKLWHKVGTATQWTAVELSTASADLDLDNVDGTDLGTDDTKAAIMVEVRADSLDGNNGFKYIQAFYEGDDIATASTIITSGWILTGATYMGAIPQDQQD